MASANEEIVYALRLQTAAFIQDVETAKAKLLELKNAFTNSVATVKIDTKQFNDIISLLSKISKAGVSSAKEVADAYAAGLSKTKAQVEDLQNKLKGLGGAAGGGDRFPSGALRGAGGSDKQTTAQKELNKELDKSLKTHEGIGLHMANQLAQAAKYLVIYAAVREIFGSIEGFFTGAIESGLKYLKETEDQKLALQAILASNFDIYDSQKNQLTGATGLAVLQKESAEEWKVIHAISLQTVGTTADLMTVYEGILPFASRLGKTVEDTQKLVKGTAIAAQFLGVSFNDARSAMDKLLMGQAPNKNRFIGALGLTAADVKDASTRWDVISNKLKMFDASAEDTQRTLAASTKAFKDFSDQIGAAADAPAVKAFVDWVQKLKASLYELNATGGLEPNPMFAQFLTSVGTAAKELITPLAQLVDEMTAAGGEGATKMLLGIVNILTPIVTLVKYVAEATVAIINFSAANLTLIEFIGVVVAGFTAFNVVANIAGWLNTVANSTTLLGKAFVFLGAETSKSAVASATDAVAKTAEAGGITAVSGAAAAGTPVVLGFGRAMGLLFTAGWISIAIAGLLYLAKLVADWVQNYRDASAYTEAMLSKDSARATLANAAFKDKNPVLWASQTTEITQMAFDKITASGLGSTDKVIAKNKEWRDGLKEVSDAMEKIIAKGDNSDARDREDMLRLEAKRRKILEDEAKFQDDLNKVREAGAARARFLSDASADQAVADKLDKEIAKARAKQQPTAEAQAQMTTGQLMMAPINIAIGKITGKTAEEDPNYIAALEKARDIAQQKAMADTRSANALSTILDKTEALADVNKREQKVTLVPRDKPAPEPLRIPKYIDHTTGELEMQKATDSALLELDKVYVAQHLMYLSDQEAAEDARLAHQHELNAEKLVTEKADIEAYAKLIDEYNLLANNNNPDAKNYQDPKILVDPRRVRANVAAVRNDGDEDRRQAQLRLVAAQRATSFADSVTTYEGILKKKEAELSGRVGDSAVAVWQAEIEKLKKLKKDAFDPADAAVYQTLIDRYTAKIPEIKTLADLNKSIASDDRIIAMRFEEEARLDKQFKEGTIGVNAYADAMTKLREEQRAAIKDQMSNVQKDINRLTNQATPDDVDPDKLALRIAQMAKLKEQLDGIKTKGDLANDALASMVASLDSIGKLINIFDVGGKQIDGWREKFKFLSDTITGAVNAGKALLSVINTIKTTWSIVRQVFQAVNTKNTGGSTGNDGSADQPDDGGSGAATGTAISTGAAIGTHTATMGAAMMGGGGAGSVGLAMTGWGLVAIAAIYVGIALYNRAVKKHTEALESGIKGITDAVNNGTMTLGESGKALREQRDAAIAKESGSKAGRKALQNTQLEYDTLQADIYKKQKEAAAAMKDTLSDLSAGQGPFGDFKRMLTDTNKQATDYLNKFEKGTAMYAQALVDINDLFAAKIAQAKAELVTQMEGFEGDAIDQAEKVISLMEAKQGLYQNLADENASLMDLNDQRNQLAKDEAQALIDQADARVQRAKDILDLEKQIADTIKKAADDEMGIRQHGVLEATTTIAQQKATQISQVRNDARDKLATLNPQLAKLKLAQDLAKAEADSAASFEKKEIALDKQEATIRKQIADTQKQIELNQIALDTATRISGLYGEVFNTDGSIFDLEKRRGELEVIAAQDRVKHWKEVASLIDSISQTAAGVTFTPPTGFPAITVAVGDIKIDNSLTDNSSSTTNNPPSAGLSSARQKLIDDWNRIRPEDHITTWAQYVEQYQRQYGTLPPNPPD